MGLEKLVEQFVNGQMGVSLLDIPGFLGAGIAEMNIVRLAPGDFGQMYLGRLVASFTECMANPFSTGPVRGRRDEEGPQAIAHVQS